MIKTRLQILEETANYYNLNNRGINNSGACVYYDKNTKNMCAVGRCLSNPKKLIDNNSTAEELFKKVITFKSLKPEYRIDDINFWSHLQQFHDTEDFWTKKGLSAFGKKHYNYLKKVYG